MVYKLTAGEVLFWVARVCLFVCLFLCCQSQEVVNSDHRLLTGLKSCLYILSKIETKNVMKYWMMCSTAEYCHPANIDKVLLAVKYWWVRGEVCCASVQLDRTVLCHTVYCSHLSSFIWEILESSSTCHHLLQKYGAGEQLRGLCTVCMQTYPESGVKSYWRPSVELYWQEVTQEVPCNAVRPSPHRMHDSIPQTFIPCATVPAGHGWHCADLGSTYWPCGQGMHLTHIHIHVPWRRHWYSRFAITRMLSVCQR